MVLAIAGLIQNHIFFFFFQHFIYAELSNGSQENNLPFLLHVITVKETTGTITCEPISQLQMFFKVASAKLDRQKLRNDTLLIATQAFSQKGQLLSQGNSL